MSTTKRLWLGLAAIVIASFGVMLWLVRSQDAVQDRSYMRSMIPHHSIAILTSERAQITDPRVRALADGIIEAQRREIAEMEALVAADTDLQARNNGAAPARVEELKAMVANINREYRRSVMRW